MDTAAWETAKHCCIPSSECGEEPPTSTDGAPFDSPPRGKERNDIIEATWQLPQGGIELGETLKDAALREMREEIGIDEVKFLRESTHWIKYDLPVEVLNRNWKRSWQGQNM